MNTEKESELLWEVTNQFWHDFSRLCGETVSKVPEHLRDDLLMHMQEHASVYGSNYDAYIK